MKNEKITAPYASPELEFITFDSRDIITTSGYRDNDYEPDQNEDNDWYDNN